MLENTLESYSNYMRKSCRELLVATASRKREISGRSVYNVAVDICDALAAMTEHWPTETALLIATLMSAYKDDEGTFKYAG